MRLLDVIRRPANDRRGGISRADERAGLDALAELDEWLTEWCDDDLDVAATIAGISIGLMLSLTADSLGFGVLYLLRGALERVRVLGDLTPEAELRSHELMDAYDSVKVMPDAS
jgi:hypothetical protein